MANKRKNIKNKSNSFYIKTFKKLQENQLVNFKHNLKFDSDGKLINKKIDPAIKGKITRHFNTLQSFKNSDIVLIKKKKSENVKQYKKRISKIRKQYSQTHNLPALIQYHSPNVKYKFDNKSNKIVIEPFYNIDNEIRYEFIELIPKLVFAIISENYDEFKRLTMKCIKKYKKLMKDKSIVYGELHLQFETAHQGHGAILNFKNPNETIDLMWSIITKLISQYNSDVLGYIIGYYIAINTLAI